MNPLELLLMLLLASVNTIAVFLSPSMRINKWFEGKKPLDEFQKLRAMDEDSVFRLVVSYGCLGGCLPFVSTLFSYALIPYYVFSAVGNHIGNEYFAYIALAITVISFIVNGKTFIVSFVKSASKRKAIEDYEGELTNEPIKINWGKIYATQAFYAIPTVYLWYLLLTIIGVIPTF